MKYILTPALIAFFIFSTQLTAKEKVAAADIYSQLKSLVGVWVKEGATQSKFKISFELTANETVLVETWMFEGKKRSLTLYHLDGMDLLATHYCPQGNQTRLQVSNDSTLSQISFKFKDATNLASLDYSHQHSLGFVFDEDLNRIRRNESYLSKSGEEPSELILIRQ